MCLPFFVMCATEFKVVLKLTFNLFYFVNFFFFFAQRDLAPNLGQEISINQILITFCSSRFSIFVNHYTSFLFERKLKKVE